MLRGMARSWPDWNSPSFCVHHDSLAGPQYFPGCGYVSSGNVEWNGENHSRLGTGESSSQCGARVDILTQNHYSASLPVDNRRDPPFFPNPLKIHKISPKNGNSSPSPFPSKFEYRAVLCEHSEWYLLRYSDSTLWAVYLGLGHSPVHLTVMLLVKYLPGDCL